MDTPMVNLFLDEIGELSPQQAKLLRALQKAGSRVGSREEVEAIRFGCDQRDLREKLTRNARGFVLRFIGEIRCHLCDKVG